MKVIIVDDEQIIRQGIKTFVPWEALKCTMVGEAANGLEALLLMEKVNADIIISDIRMPLMDGLDLSRELRLKYPDCRIILLTGYEDFDYARKALQYQVEDYLLKPVGDDELTKVIGKTVKKLEAEINRQKKNIQLKNMIIENKESILKNYIENLITGNIPDSRILPKIEDLHINIFEHGIYQLIIIFPDQDFSEILIPENSFIIPYFIDRQEGRLVLHHIDPLEDTFFKNLKSKNISAAVGSKVAGISNLQDSLQEAESACTYRCFLNSPALIHQSDKEFFKTRFLRMLPDPLSYEDVEIRIIEMFHSLHPEIKDLLSSLLHSCVLDGNRQEDFIRYCRRFYNLARKEVERKGIKISLNKNDPFEKVNIYDPWKTIQEKTEQIFFGLEENVLNSSKKQFSLITSQTISYIEKHFKENISLSYIADTLAVSESHISRIFKKETGINFVPWVNKYRVEYSLDLLASGEYKLYDIADLSGFSDYKYYTRQFKRVMGISPTEFRKNLLSPQK
ncbi:MULTISPECIES: response regulator [unclassified Oceanispirochaeta]|uniref:response regulator n=1 Tax=unclassified Oceanispirochaeta TaxID=2635722 RepID=UPI000E09D480|nr:MULTISPECIES: response regulator [unclassified Oceanispirochaeta]MBF9016502.1 response regulator [Oceanispirochaeta sp. M2]NPD72964.1 response regulator [Oceanispirochaeta sp. M1]RDG31308.1 response regulator [Oceanispirochaeta sp. M1]